MTETNYSMLCDFYELTMSNGYFKNGFYKKTVYFDLFFRKVPDNGGFAIAAGLEQVIDYIKNLHFSETDIEYLREKGIFDEEFLKYLSNFKFTGDIYAIPEGTPIFPNEPIITVKAPAIEAQLIETFLLLTINHQTLIATKANRIVRAAQGRTVLEFGSRRAQGATGAVDGARAAYIGRYSLHTYRRTLRRTRRRHNGSFLDSDVRQRIYSIPHLLRALSREPDASCRYLQHA